MSDDLFASSTPRTGADYDAHSIKVLEGLEPVRRRPGMYVGGVDERALHHEPVRNAQVRSAPHCAALSGDRATCASPDIRSHAGGMACRLIAAEVLDNSMDEAVAGHASRIEVTLEAGNRLTVADNGRGIPVDEHPRYPGKSALEVILTTLHSGGKFSQHAYATSGGLHGVGVSVVNALSSDTIVEVARGKRLYRQTFARGLPTSALTDLGPTQNRRGTTLSFTPDAQIFGEEAKFKPARLYRLARSKAYLFAGVEIRWRCDPDLAER